MHIFFAICISIIGCINKENIMMKNNERKQQIDAVNKKLDQINAKLKEVAASAANKSYDAKEELEARINDAKNEVDKFKNKRSDEVAFARAKHELFKDNLQEKKEADDARKLAKYIDDMIEYSDNCAELSLLFAAESKAAMLEALLAMEEFDEKYTEDEGEEE